MCVYVCVCVRVRVCLCGCVGACVCIILCAYICACVHINAFIEYVLRLVIFNNFTNVLGGAVVHSYGRLILHERVITDRHQLQPPNNDNGDGRIECAVSSGEARFSYGRYNVPNADSKKATAVIPAGDFNPRNFRDVEGSCGSIYHYLYLVNGEIRAMC